MYRLTPSNLKSNERATVCVSSSPGAPPGTTAQPNDLWRFFPSSEQAEKPLPAQSTFVEELLRADETASTRVKEVMGVMELYETATSSWGEKQPVTSSRKWFAPPETSFEVAECPERSLKEIHALKKNSLEGNGQEVTDWIPSWRVLSAAVYLSSTSRAALLKRCPPKMNRTAGDHMSLMHSPDAMAVLSVPLGKTVKLMAYGEKCTVVAQQVALKPPNGLPTRKTHPHVTVSFAERVLKRDIAAMKGNGSFDRWVFPLELEGVIGIKMDNGRVLFSDEEFYIETGVDLREIRKQSAMEDAESEELIESGSLEETQPEARPSEEIRRLMAQDSFSSKPDDVCAQLMPPPQDTLLDSLQDGAGRHLEKSLSAKEVRGIIRLPAEEVPGTKILRVSKNKSLFERTLSPSRMSTTDHMQHQIKEKQAKLKVECEDHRQASRKAQREGDEYLEFARVAYREGNREKGDNYNRLSQEAMLKHREHTNKAERLAFEASNMGRINTHTVDLHLLHLQEAIARLKKVINGLSSFVEDIGTIYRLRIITGKGSNSLDNVPILRPAVLEYLKTGGLDAEVDEHNEGVVIAYINPTAS